MFLWAEFRDPRFYHSSCESLPSIATIGGLIEAARLGTSHAELKNGTTRAPIDRVLWNLSLPRRIQITSKCRLSFSTNLRDYKLFTVHWQGKNGYVWFSCNTGVVQWGLTCDDSPDMDVIGISVIRREIGNKVLKTSVSGLVELNILKNLTVNVVAGSLGRFKSHASNIVFDLFAKIQPKTWRALKLMETINSNHRTFTISTITEDTIIENHGKEHSENILPSSEGDVGLAASSGPSVLGDKVDEECAAADPPEISYAQNNRKRCRE
ncbi:hypothetical protein HID58_072881 [Brassica napus]|uniref:Uncharacterized protein n=1 Tax=Brassica napus TaxID=3708 RepID=A0ABQ7Z5P0_BRANA|nr:hypothetical protein HID58_072881 [Brassica napus]